MPDWRQWSSHKQRWITGILLVIPLLVALSLGPLWVWTILVGSFACIGLWEFQRLVFSEGLSLKWQAFYISIALAFPIGAFLGGAAGLQCALLLALFSGFFSFLLFSPLDPKGITRIALFTLGWVYIPFNLSYVLLLGQTAQARTWMFFILLVIAAGDTGAYYSGRKWGKHKLYPQVSPNKTIEGSLGGLLAGILIGVSFGRLFIEEIGLIEIGLLCLILAAVGQIGDLIESMLKRISGHKDSSGLLPGHGGILDRLDSLFFVFPTTWYFLEWAAK
jgi:phosphatidate cytidylyltransferase